MELFTNAAVGLKENTKIKRESIDQRVAKMVERIALHPDDHYLLWHDQEKERLAIKEALPDVVNIYGSMNYEECEKCVVDFSEGKTRLFVTKKSLSGSGCNFQRFATGRYFFALIMNLMILYKQFIDVIVSYRVSR